MNDDIERLREWIGRVESTEETLAPEPVLRLHATLDDELPCPRAGDALPISWHWLYFLPSAPTREIGTDGHARRGGFLPPVALPRRMFAGSQITCHAPLRLGALARRDREVVSIEQKAGREGPLIFVGVLDQIHSSGQLCIEERQTIVYRGEGSPVSLAPRGAEWPVVPAGTWTRIVNPDPVLTFRFAALTFNAHRIHYDRPYATQLEGYPGLIVQGPMIAMLLAQLVRHNDGRRIESFTFRARTPLYDTAPFRLLGRAEERVVRLHAEGPGGTLAMEAEARLAPAA